MTPPPHHDPVERLNAHHADDLLATARAFSGCPDATAARAERVDRSGIDLELDTPRGRTKARVEFTELVTDVERAALRRAFSVLARQARAVLAADGTN
jgi:hypothetical protein